jgi:hypothetical protein
MSSSGNKTTSVEDVNIVDEKRVTSYSVSRHPGTNLKKFNLGLQKSKQFWKVPQIN